MKTLILATVLSATAFGASAQPVPDPQLMGDDGTVTITAKGPAIALPAHPRTMSPSDYAQFTGSYELANGDSIALFSRGLKKYAAMHGGAWHEVVAANGSSFVAKDRSLRVSFIADDEGHLVGGDVLMLVPDDRTAKLIHGRKQQPRMKVQDVAMR